MTAPLHCLLVGSCVFRPFHLGWAGVPLAESATAWLTAALFVMHVPTTHVAWSKEFRLAWYTLRPLALAGAGLFATAFWHRHVLTLTVAAASDARLYEAQAILHPVLVAARCVGTGLSLATAWQTKHLAKAVALGCWTAFGLGIVLAGVTWFGCGAWASLLAEPALTTEVTRVLPLVAAYLLADLVLAVFLGAMLSAGKIAVAVAIQGIAFYGISWPVAYAAPATLGGLWLATALGPICGVIGFMIYLYRADWSKDPAACDM